MTKLPARSNKSSHDVWPTNVCEVPYIQVAENLHIFLVKASKNTADRLVPGSTVFLLTYHEDTNDLILVSSEVGLLPASRSCKEMKSDDPSYEKYR